MKNAIRGQYKLEFKQEAIRLVQGGETVAAAAKSLGISGQTLHNWVKANAAGQFREVAGKAISAEQMEINAVTETLFGSLKVERLNGIRFETRRQAKDEVIEWLRFYNC